MITRTQLLLPLRPWLLLATLRLSTVAWLICPAVALVILLLAGLASVVIEILFVVAVVAGGILFVGGAIALAVGLLGQQAEAGGVGILACATGGGLCVLAPHLNVAGQAFSIISIPAQFMIDWFVNDAYLGIWLWFPAVVIFLVAGCAWIAVILARHVPEIWAHWQGRFHDCPRCHYRGRLLYACPRCGTVERDLRASPYGLRYRPCHNCGTSLPTLDMLGRHQLKKICANCSTSLCNENIGLFPVRHVALLHTDCDIAPCTTLGVIAGKLVYLHELSVQRLALPPASSPPVFPTRLDQVMVCGDEASFQKTQPLLAATFGVLERSLGLDVRRCSKIPASIISGSTKPLAKIGSNCPPAAAQWAASLGAAFKPTAVWGGPITGATIIAILNQHGA